VSSFDSGDEGLLLPPLSYAFPLKLPLAYEIAFVSLVNALPRELIEPYDIKRSVYL